MEGLMINIPIPVTSVTGQVSAFPNDLSDVLSQVLVPMLMILLCILGVIRHLICGSSLSWLLNLNLIYRALWTGLGSD